MVKKHTKRSRQYGGSWNPFSSNFWSSSDPNNILNKTKTGVLSITTSTENALGSVSDKVTGLFSSGTSQPVTQGPVDPSQMNQQSTNQYPMNQQSTNQQSTNQQQVTQGPTNQQSDSQLGGKKAKSRKMKGGQGIAEYASPVNNLKVAEPTYWEYYGKGNVKTGGKKRKSQSKRKHKRRQTRRH
jgi:hypothetical protein